MNDLAKIPRETSLLNRNEMIKLALEKGSNLTQLEKLFELQLKYEVNEARKAYHVAMAKFKENPPEIEKDRKVSFGQGKASYYHATLYNVVEKISKSLSEHGFSAGWKTDQNESGLISVTCVITHEQGHKEETTISAMPDDSGSKNKIQAIGSTITYLERYTLLALTGLATYEQDNDAQSAEKINEKQLGTILDYINNLDIDEKEFLKFMQVESLELIPEADFNKAMKALKEKEKRMKS